MNLTALTAAAALLGAISSGTCSRKAGESGPGAAPSAAASGSEAAPAPGEASAAGMVLAVCTADARLAATIRQGDFFRWALPRLGGAGVEVGPEARGEPLVIAELLPPSPDMAALLRGLPVELSAQEIALAGQRYPAAGRALAVRVPGAAAATWVVTGGGEEAVAEMANELLFRLAGRRRARARDSSDLDYALRESSWLQRTGRWRAAGEGRFEVDPAAERDDIAERDRAFTALVTVPGASSEPGITLLAAPAAAARPEVRSLAADLDVAARSMARRIPLALDRPLTVAVEPDYLAQARHTGEVGEAVVGEDGAVNGGGRADLTLVVDPQDGAAYRHAVARVLLGRAGLGKETPLWLARGAALWLSGDWYGHPWRDWIPTLAAARALPTAEQLLAVREQGDSSVLLWTSAAAGIVDRLPGATLREKLARVPSAAALTASLSALARTAPAAGVAPALPGRPAPPAPVFPPFLRGVSLAMLNSLDGGYHAPGLRDRLAGLSSLGADAVSLMPFAFQPAPDSPDLTFLHRGPEGETDLGLIHAARVSHAQGLRVLYKPHIWVSHRSWPGEIEMKSEEDWRRWWEGYRRYVLHHAVLAAWTKCEAFSIGVELSRTLGREAEWRDLIAAVRLVYGGAVTYAGNWDGDLERAPFWDRLDLVGIDAYFPLSASATASPDELARGAQQVVAHLEAAARRTGKPLLLTEVGFAAQRAAWVAPHTEGGALSESDQALAYEALLGALGRPPWLAGTFVWKAFSGDVRWARGEADFRFLGRPAEAAVRRYYRGRDGVRPSSARP